MFNFLNKKKGPMATKTEMPAPKITNTAGPLRFKTINAAQELMDALKSAESPESCSRYLKTVDNALWQEKEDLLLKRIEASRVNK